MIFGPSLVQFNLINSIGGEHYHIIILRESLWIIAYLTRHWSSTLLRSSLAPLGQRPSQNCVAPNTHTKNGEISRDRKKKYADFFFDREKSESIFSSTFRTKNCSTPTSGFLALSPSLLFYSKKNFSQNSTNLLCVRKFSAVLIILKKRSNFLFFQLRFFSFFAHYKTELDLGC